MDVFDEARKTHEVWYKFCDHMKEWYYKEAPDFEILSNQKIVKTGRLHKELDTSKMIGYECIQRCEKYAKKNKEIKIISVDDSVHAGSIVILIPHPDMGITVIFVPQCTDVQNQFFLYPHHAHNLTLEILKMSYEVDGRL